MPRHFIYFLRCAFIGLTCLAAAKATASTQVRIAILAFRPAAEVQQRWQPLVDHLNASVPGYRFGIEALGYAALESAIARRAVDFVFTNPGHYTLMTYRNGLSSPLATLLPVENERVVGKFGGVIIARSDRVDLGLLTHLRGKVVAAVTKGSLGGYQAQAMELAAMGIKIPRHVRLLETGMPHDRVVKAVLERRADAGFVRTGVLEDMASEGKIDLAQVKVIAPKSMPDFPFLLSTQLYPEWPFSAMPGVDEDLARQVAAVLLSVAHGGDLAKRLDIHGFTIPTDYETVRNMLEVLRLPPFDGAPEFTAEDVWMKYRWEALAGLSLISVIVLLTFMLLFLNRQLAQERGRIQHASQEWRRLLTALGEGVYGVDTDGNCTFINPAAQAMLGFADNEVLGRDQHALFHHHRKDGAHYPVAECPISLTLRDGVARNWTDWFWRKDGSGFPVTLTTAPMGESGGRRGTVVVFRDISEQQQKEDQLRKEATTDPLTGAANRRLFLEQLQAELIRYRRFGESAAVIMVDIDHFKRINDTYGHATGDAVLRHFTHLSLQCLRRSDLLARLGGEEFGIMLPVTDAADAGDFAERYRRLVAETPLRNGTGEVAFTVSMGVATLRSGDESAEEVLARADKALYRAKEAGRNRVESEVPEGAESTPRHVGRSFVHLRWKPHYTCGETRIDDEHRALFQRTNGFLDQVDESGAPLQEVTAAFDQLLAHVEAHFIHEEAILRERGYALVDEHAGLHRQLLAHAKALRARLDQGRVHQGELVNFLVSQVVAGHMLEEDRKFYDIFKRRANA